MDFGTTLKVVLVPVVAILGGVGLPALVVYLVLHYRFRQQELLHATVQRMAENGLPIPPALLDPPRRPPRQSPQFNAITTLGVAVGLVLMFLMLDLRPLVGVGVLVGCIGIAQLIALRLEPKQPGAGGPG